jgi:hypothetical protein
MQILIHALVIVTVMLGSDLIANGGEETRKLVAGIDIETVWNHAKLGNYHATAGLKQGAVDARPQLSIAGLAP